MLAVEQGFALPGESIADLLKKLYQDEKKPLATISREFSTGGGFSVSKSILGRWMKQFHPDIKIRQLRDMLQNPEQEEYRLSRVKAAFRDPVKRKQAVAKIHTPESDAKRSQTLSDYWTKSPQLKTEFIRHVMEGRRKKSAKRMADFLGTDPKKTLTHLLDVEDLTVREIANKAGRSVSKVREWLVEFGVNTRNRRRGVTTEQINERRAKIQKATEVDLFGLLTPRQQQVLMALYRESVAPTPVKVANDFHLTPARVRQLDSKGLAKVDMLLEFGPESLKRPSKIDGLLGDNPSSTLTVLYVDQGLSLSDIADKLGCSPDTVGYRLKKLNIPARSRGRPRKS